MSSHRTRPVVTRRLGTLACLALVTVLFFAVPGAAPVEASVTIGGDVAAQEAMDALGRADILPGHEAGSTVPQEFATRGQLAILLARVLGLKGVNATPFTDVPVDEECRGAVGALYDAGVISGTTPTTFSPDSLISRQRAVLWIVEALGYQVARGSFALVPYRYTYYEDTGAWLGAFEDRPLIYADCARAVANALRLGLIEADGDARFYPKLPLSQGDMAIMLERAFLRTVQARADLPMAVPAKSSYAMPKNGSEGTLVWYLESQLTALKYCPGPIDGVYDYRTKDAVMAFQKVERLKRNGWVGDSVWSRIFGGQTPTPKLTGEGTRVEVDLTRQVLFIIEDDQVRKIVHVSTGQNGTRTGHFKIQSKYKGWVNLVTLSGRIYYPSYVVSKTAIHGYPSVPSYPASHGCVRVPMWMAADLWYETPSGMTVDIYYNR